MFETAHLHELIFTRYHICVRPDGYGKDLHHGGRAGAAGATRHHPQLLCPHLWTDRQGWGRRQVPGAGLVPGDLQRGGEGSAGQERKPEIGGEEEALK